MTRWVLLLLFCLHSMNVSAHARNNAFLDLVQTPGNLSGALQLRLEDLPLISNIDADHNSELTWGEVKGARDEITAYVGAGLQISHESGVCQIELGEFQIQNLAAGNYLFIPLHAECPETATHIAVDYHLLFAADAAHRGLMKLQSDESSAVFVFAPGQEQFNIEIGNLSTFTYMLTFVEEGVWHIWTGYDHLLFLLALLLPLFGTRTNLQSSTPDTLKTVVVKVLKLVTAFTVAHSITLIGTSIYQPAFEPALIETLIAISVVLAGLNILLPMFDKGHWRIAFCFGLLHGLGFATALSGLELPADYFIECLLSFNLGVELGQLAIVLPCIPLLLLLSRQFYYRTMAMPVMALAVISCSLWWTVERVVQI
ncbi:MAG: HupE/UreJ family protein [Pseudomonadota bacterium]